ncbi:hypothetical protein NPIL_403521 [Nephila pilipes]|uniref:Uncharacterized protein n=1 Tax=Nephila pilipes TaxID=299642 RepID=A0A8X6NPF3_NEPPI|nr:hypothetical protein NPIL_403521 [Nephila pilipes]
MLIELSYGREDTGPDDLSLSDYADLRLMEQFLDRGKNATTKNKDKGKNEHFLTSDTLELKTKILALSAQRNNQGWKL